MNKLSLYIIGSLSAFAVPAYAEFSYFGSAEIGYNENTDEFYRASVGINYDNYSLSVGHVPMATDHYDHFEGMNFKFYDPGTDNNSGFYDPLVIRADAYLGFADVSVSYEIHEGTGSFLNSGLAVGISSEFSGFDLGFAYQDKGVFIGCCGIEGTGYSYAVSVGYDFGALSTKLAYFHNDHSPFSEIYEAVGLEVGYDLGQYQINGFVSGNSAGSSGGFTKVLYGVSAAYSAGSIVAETYYRTGYDNDSGVDYDTFGLDLSYAFAKDFELYAGYDDRDGGYAGIVYGGLMENTEIGVSYSEYQSARDLGNNNFKRGATVWLKTTF